MDTTHDVLLMRFAGPLMSFGGPLTDSLGRTELLPQRSMIAGLLANALGYEHRDHARLARLQQRVCYAAREDRAGRTVVDYQTVDLGQPSLVDTGWTTRGTLESRGGLSAEGTHIRERHYLADASYLVALRLDAPDEQPTLDHLASALRAPERPLFLGRKCCLPSEPVFEGRVRADSLHDALRIAPLPKGLSQGEPRKAWWGDADAPEEANAVAREVVVYDQRDWLNQIHSGRRYMREGLVTPMEVRR